MHESSETTSNEVIQGFDSVIQNQSMLINDRLFSNYKLIRQNQLTSMGYQIVMSLLQSFI